MNQIIRQRVKSCSRIKRYQVNGIDPTGEKFEVLVDFTQTQANQISLGCVVETDGVAIDIAIALVRNWNKVAKTQGRGTIYSIPFVPSCKTNP